MDSNLLVLPKQQRTHSEIEYKDLLQELQNTQKRLESKVEALVAVSEELSRCQNDRDSWKAAANTYERNLTRIEACYEKEKSDWEKRETQLRNDLTDTGALAQHLRTANKSLIDENAAIKLDLRESKEDMKMLRQKLARHQLKEYYEPEHEKQSSSAYKSLRRLSGASKDSEGGAMPSPTAHKTPASRTNSGGNPVFGFQIVQQQIAECSDVEQTTANPGSLQDLEKAREQYTQLERDLRSVLCEKEELISERESYKTKLDRITQEMGYMINGDDRKIVGDLDGILAENRYLKAQLSSAQEETGLARAALTKYRQLVERRKNRIAEASQGHNNANSGALTVVTPKQVRDILGCDSSSHSGITDETTDYRALATALFDAVNDKQLALTHQRKANKILGCRLTELEVKLQEVQEARSPSKLQQQPLIDNVSDSDVQASNDDISSGRFKFPLECVGTQTDDEVPFSDTRTSSESTYRDERDDAESFNTTFETN